MIYENVGSTLTLDHVVPFIGASRGRCETVLSLFCDAEVLEEVTLLQCSKHESVTFEADVASKPKYCDQCDRQLERSELIEANAFKVIVQTSGVSMSRRKAIVSGEAGEGGEKATEGLPKDIDVLSQRKEHYRFDVAISFAGDGKRDKVREVAETLRAHLGDGKVFFDEFFEAEIAGSNADTYLQKIYRNETRLVVTSVCKRYNEKPWTRAEWRAIRSFQSELSDENRSRFLPLRFGDGEVDGLFSTLDIVPDVRDRSSEEIVALIRKRLELVNDRRGKAEQREHDSSKQVVENGYDLLGFPLGPIVMAKDIPMELVDIFVDAFEASPSTAPRFLAKAMKARENANPEEKPVRSILVTAGQLPSAAAGLEEYWAAAIHVAGQRSRRTLAALMLTPGSPDPETLSTENRKLYKSFLRFLMNPN